MAKETTVQVSIVTDKGKVLKVTEAVWDSFNDAAGDIDGGDFWSLVAEEHPGVKVKEIRLTTNTPLEIEGE